MPHNIHSFDSNNLDYIAIELLVIIKVNFEVYRKGTGSRDIIQIFMHKNGFFKFSNAPLMSCRHCHVPSGEFENVLEK
jgi:hypothetical protein